MKQTAVEWQFEQLFNSFEKFNNGEYTFNDYLKRNLEIRKQAKEMEKEQMIEFAKYTSRIDTEKSDMNKVIDFYLTLDGEEFVEENFKSE